MFLRSDCSSVEQVAAFDLRDLTQITSHSLAGVSETIDVADYQFALRAQALHT